MGYFFLVWDLFFLSFCDLLYTSPSRYSPFFFRPSQKECHYLPKLTFHALKRGHTMRKTLVFFKGNFSQITFEAQMLLQEGHKMRETKENSKKQRPTNTTTTRYLPFYHGQTETATLSHAPGKAQFRQLISHMEESQCLIPKPN